jgi:hypothetical protein
MKTTTFKKIGFTALCIFFLTIAARNTQAEDIVMIDNYNDGNPGANTFGFWTGWGKGNYGGFNVRERNGIKQFTYNLPGFYDYGWYASNVYGSLYFLDFSDYDYLSFSIKGSKPLAPPFNFPPFSIQLQYSNPENGGPGPFDELEYDKLFEIFGVTTEWQRVYIPLNLFPRASKTKLRSVAFVFKAVPPYQGTIYLDNLSFIDSDGSPTPTELPKNILMVDNYNDENLNANSLGYRTGGNVNKNFIMDEKMLYDYDEEIWPGVDEKNRARKLEYNCVKKNDKFSYTSYLWNGFSPFTLTDITEFDHLSFRIKGENGSEKFIIQIRYGDSRHRLHSLLAEITSSGYFNITDEWQQVNIPLDEFPAFDKTRIQAISMVFQHDPESYMNRGTVYLDNLAFSKGYGKKDESAGPVRIDRIENLLYVDNEPFYIKGVGYQAVPVGKFPPTPDDINIFRRDFIYLQEMGCNAIRTWSEPGANLMTEAANRGLKVIAGFWLDDGLDYTNPDVRKCMKMRFEGFVKYIKNLPGAASNALLMWAIGNECNYDTSISSPHYYSFANELAKTVYELEGASYHPVMVINGKLFNIGKDERGAEDMQLNYLDAWGANLYAKDYHAVDWFSEPRNIFEVYKAKSSKPLIITEYGADAFHTTNPADPVSGREDQDEQATWVRRNTLEIMNASDACLGACIMAYSDEWWKDSTGRPDRHDNGPTIGIDRGIHLPDGCANEEWWGIFSASKSGYGPDNITPREVYYELQEIFTQHTVIRADFEAFPTTGTAPFTVNFTDLSIGDVLNWTWDFGDGTTSNKQNPSHAYRIPGRYTVGLIVKGVNVSDVETKLNYIDVTKGVDTGYGYGQPY